MSENANKEQVKSKNWFQGMSAKNTIAVVVSSVVLGLIIAGIDFLATWGVSLLGNI